MQLHIAVCSINFNKSPEGVCTGLLVRALLNTNCKVTLITSPKAQLGFTHSNLSIVVYKHKPREPRFLWAFLARLEKKLSHPFYMWARTASKHSFNRDSIPDIIYGRAWPYSSLIPALALAERYKRPLITHLSDPIPPPNEEGQHPFLKHFQNLANKSAALTFTNNETIAYQSNFTQFKPSKAFVLNHIAPVYDDLPSPSHPEQYFYTGAIGNRKSTLSIVINGFIAHQAKHPDASLNFVCSTPNDVQPVIDAHQANNVVHLLPFAPDITDIYQQASALISLEPEVGKPIWTLTKTIHYLQTNRKVFALTSPGSPTEKILREFPESCVVVTQYTAHAIEEGFNQLQKLKPGHVHYSNRFKAMQEFTSSQVAEKFLAICEHIIS